MTSRRYTEEIQVHQFQNTDPLGFTSETKIEDSNLEQVWRAVKFAQWKSLKLGLKRPLVCIRTNSLWIWQPAMPGASLPWISLVITAWLKVVGKNFRPIRLAGLSRRGLSSAAWWNSCQLGTPPDEPERFLDFSSLSRHEGTQRVWSQTPGKEKEKRKKKSLKFCL